jgi:hypothetical protein
LEKISLAVAAVAVVHLLLQTLVLEAMVVTMVLEVVAVVLQQTQLVILEQVETEPMDTWLSLVMLKECL